MPENQLEHVHSNILQKLLEEIVLVGVGVLLVFLGVFSTVPLTSIFSVGIGAFLFYTAYGSYRKKFPSQEPIDTNDEENDEIVEEDEKQITVERTFPASKKNEPVQLQHDVEKPKTNIFTQRVVEEKQIPLMNQIEPQSEFNNLLIKVLQIVKEVCFAHSVIFFWVKNETRQLVVEGKITDSDAFADERKLPIGVDIISRIGINGQPQIINNISTETERDILCYYRNLQDIKSFIGVPVFYAGDSSSQPIGVLAVDSKAEDAYGDETFTILSDTTKLISALLISYTEKYDLFADVKLIEADSKIKKKISNHPSIATVVNALTEELENIVAWDSISVVLFDDHQRAWGIASTRVRGSDKFVATKQLIDLEESIVGHSIKTNSVQTINLAQNTKTIFNTSESSSDVLKQGTLVVVPFSSGGKCFGAVAVSHRKANGYSKKDIETIQYLSSTISSEFEIAELNSILNEHIAVDEQTGTLSKKYFTARLNEELSRATDREEDLSLVFISLSNLSDIEMRYDVDGKEGALIHVARHLRASVRPYDIVARYDASTFAVTLADTIANDAFLWAEKLRTAIAGSIVTIGRKSFSISVTIGISGAAAKMSGDELMKNVSHVLDQAKRAGGNIVRVF